MKLFLAQTDPHWDSVLRDVLEEVLETERTHVGLVVRTTPEATRANIQTATAVFGNWSISDYEAVGELAYAAGVGRPVYIVSKNGPPPWFCSGLGHGGHYPSAHRAAVAFIRDMMARREARASEDAAQDRQQQHLSKT